jgi:hypothetical protein
MPAPHDFGRFARGFLTIWTVVVVPFDCILVYGMWAQLRALSFPTTDGVITRSGVKFGGDDGDSTRLDLAYAYEVGGRRYTGTRYSYAEIGTNTGAWHRVQRRLPVGARVPVSYDPDDPAESLLHPGPTGMHLFLAWFLIPFNVIAVGGWIWYARRNRPEFDRRQVRRTRSGWVVRPTSLFRLGVFAGVLAGIAFLGSFVWAVGWGFDPPVSVIGVASVVALAVAAAVALAFPLPRVEVNLAERVLRFDGGEIPFRVIRSVAVDEEVKTESGGQVKRTYHCAVVWVDPAGAETPVRVASYGKRPDADAFVAWLREALGLEDGGPA